MDAQNREAVLPRTEFVPDEKPLDPEVVEQVVINGHLSRLSSAQKLAYYHNVCKSLGLNPLTKPFQYVMLNGKLQLYALRECTEQLRASRRVSVTIAAREMMKENQVYVVTARATMPSQGQPRTDESTGVVSLGNLKGDALANAMMKAETKAKRRVTLSICGLGMLDETEIASIPDAQVAPTTDPVATVETSAELDGYLDKSSEPEDEVARIGKLCKRASEAASLDELRAVGDDYKAQGFKVYKASEFYKVCEKRAKELRIEADARAQVDKERDMSKALKGAALPPIGDALKSAIIRGPIPGAASSDVRSWRGASTEEWLGLDDTERRKAGDITQTQLEAIFQEFPGVDEGSIIALIREHFDKQLAGMQLDLHELWQLSWVLAAEVLTAKGTKHE